MSKEAINLPPMPAGYINPGMSPVYSASMMMAYAEQAVREALASEAIEQPAPVAKPRKQEPVAAECKFDREQKWMRCEIAHHNLVQSEPEKWPGYQTRLLYTSHQHSASRLRIIRR